MAVYTRGEVSERTGIGFHALRYYEQFGLLPGVGRSSGRYRQYDDSMVERLLYIRQAQKCGFTLGEIKNTLEMLDDPQACDRNSDEIIDQKVQEIDQKIKELSRMRAMLLAVKEPLRMQSCEQIITFSPDSLLQSNPE